jgi:hypothetical protein
MRAETAIRILGRIYLLLFAGLVIVWSIRPDTVRELAPFLPFDIDWPTPRLIFTLTVALLVLCLLAGWERRSRLTNFIALNRARRSHPRRTGRWQSHVDLSLLLLAGIAIPFLLAFPPRFAAESLSLDGREQEARDRLRAAGLQVTRIQTIPSPDPPRDNRTISRLPVFEIEIPPMSRHHLTAALPRQSGGGSYFSLYSGDSFAWPYLPAFFTYDGRRYPIDIRYRGWNSDHYLGFKKSWRLRFRKNDLFLGRRQFNIINQRDHSLVNDILWSELLRESGIMVPYQMLAHVRINKEFTGVQTFLEQPDRYFAERHNRNVADIFGEEKPITGAAWFARPDFWQQYASHSETEDVTPLLRLYEVINDKDHPDYETRIERSLDVDHYLKYLAHGTINCQENPSTHNIRWIRDPGIGRFQIIPWYQAPNKFILTGYHRLWQRKGWHFHPPMTAINDLADGLLRRPKYRHRYLVHLWRLLRSTHHSDRIREKIAELQTLFRPDAWADTHMHYDADMKRYVSNSEWERTVANLRTMITDRLRYLAQATAGGPIQMTTNRWQTSLSADLVLTNYADANLQSLELQLDREASANDLRLIISSPIDGSESTYRPDQGTNPFTARFSPNHSLAAGKTRTPVPLGPGIIVADLDRVDNPDLAFMGGVSKLAPHFRPAPTTYRLRLKSAKSITPKLVAMVVLNSVTGERLPITHSDGSEIFPGSVSSSPTYSPEVEKLVCPHPPPPPRTPIATLKSIRPDGIVLRHSSTNDPMQTVTIGADIAVASNLIVAEDQILTIAPGTTLKFAGDASLIVYGQLIAIGTGDQPIRFTAADSRSSWGAVFLNSLTDRTNRFEHCLFEQSTNTIINRLPVTAALAAYTAPVTVSNCIFRNITADDAFNSKYVSPTISHSTFSNNLDAIDIDMGGGRITASRFIDNRDDCIDLSSAWTLIDGNDIHSHGDKGISVGEKSKVLIYNNVITDALMGIAVKDLSHALILNNSLVNNRNAGVALYEKKPSFGAASAELINNVLHQNGTAITADAKSVASTRHTSSAPARTGPGNINQPPEYAGGWILPADSPLRSAGNGESPSTYDLPAGAPLVHVGARRW